MREIDLNGMDIVQVGLEWPHPQNPTSREMLPLLERKEQYVSWLQPASGSVDDQLPSMQINGRFFALSLRLQKVLFRHVRLQHDFVNRERTADGKLKLRIPVTLYQDKKKTALRFMMMRGARNDGKYGGARGNAATKCECMDFVQAVTANPKDNNLAFFDEVSTTNPTQFSMQEEEVLREMVQQLATDCPNIMSDREKLLAAVGREFDMQHGI